MIANSLYYLLTALELALLLRMILSITDPEEEGAVLRFTSFLTEPLLVLGERILALFSISNDGIFDWSFFTAMLLTSLLKLILGPAL